MSDTIKPGVVTKSGEIVYPTNFEWLLAFALHGCKWAEDALPEAISNHEAMEVELTLGQYI
jgi:hypothetical protein